MCSILDMYVDYVDFLAESGLLLSNGACVKDLGRSALRICEVIFAKENIRKLRLSALCGNECLQI